VRARALAPGGGLRQAPGLLASALLAGPVMVGLAYSVLGALGLVGPGASGQVGPDRLVRVLSEGVVWRGAVWSLWVAAASTGLATIGAVAVAVVFRDGAVSHRVGRSLALLPLPIPHVVAGVTGILILSQSGLLARLAWAAGWIDAPAGMPVLVYDRPGVGFIVAMSWKELPFLALLATSVLATRGRGLEETARSLGAGPLATFRRVTWPLLWRGLLPGCVAVFTFVAGSYEAAALLAPSDPLALPLLAWERYHDAALDRRGDAYVLALLGFLLAAAAVYLTGSAWPDILTGVAVALLFLHSARQVLREAWTDWRNAGTGARRCA